MGHPEDTIYHFLWVYTDNDDVSGTHIDVSLSSIDGDPFNGQRLYDQSSIFVLIDCRSTDLISTYPELSDHIITSPPSWITSVVGSNPENSSHVNTVNLVATEGVSGAAWSGVIS